MEPTVLSVYTYKVSILIVNRDCIHVHTVIIQIMAHALIKDHVME